MHSAPDEAPAEKEPQELKSGDVLGRYQLLFPVGEGGMARVWLGRLRGARGFDKLVAIKVLLAEFLGRPNFEQMFIDEARIASSISHANVVEVLDVGEDRGNLYLVMEWLEGVTLSALMRRVRRGEHLPIPIAVRLIAQACAGLHATHQLRDDADALLGIVHGDVSPQNLIVTYDGSVKLIDFGVASTSLNETSTVSKFVVGKPSYMAPEQRRGEGLDRRADVFALGIVLYKLTTGVHPFNPTLAKPIESSDFAQPALPPRAVAPDYPEGLERIVLQALVLDPEQRLKTADELAKALDALPHQYRSATDEDIAQHIRGWFGSERRDLRNRIEAELGRLKLLTPMPTISFLPDEAPTAPEGETGESPPMVAKATSGALEPRQALSSFPPWEAHPSPRGQRLRWSMIAGGMALALALAVAVTSQLREQPASQHPSQPAAPAVPKTLVAPPEPPASSKSSSLPAEAVPSETSGEPVTSGEASAAASAAPMASAGASASPVAVAPAVPGRASTAPVASAATSVPAAPAEAVPAPAPARIYSFPRKPQGVRSRGWRQDPGF
jgi:serine/threonine protein kinase